MWVFSRCIMKWVTFWKSWCAAWVKHPFKNGFECNRIRKAHWCCVRLHITIILWDAVNSTFCYRKRIAWVGVHPVSATRKPRAGNGVLVRATLRPRKKRPPGPPPSSAHAGQMPLCLWCPLYPDAPPGPHHGAGWYMDMSQDDLRWPCGRELAQNLFLEANTYENDPELETFPPKGNYSWMGIITIYKDKLPIYEGKIKIFCEKHLHLAVKFASSWMAVVLWCER